MIKLIMCDFTGVVVTGGHKKLAREISEKYGLDYDLVFDTIYRKYFDEFAINNISEQEAFEGPIKELGMEETWQELVEMYLRTHVLNNPMVDYIRELRKNYTVVLLTKNIKHYLDWERKEFGLDEMFDDIVNTSEINLPKASVETLEYMLKKFNVKPEEVLYIDDQEVNLEDAKEMGVHTVLYKDFDQVKNEFKTILNN
ncbi:hypothetical protein C0581_00895 [Candidatus Parcubacteria bacterium]|nr:MAG: hypothetical protein C0581_00895 [Candidatus Parcubacteria bacterium]